MKNTIELHDLLLRAAEELEPLPAAVVQLASAINSPDTGPEELAAILSTDPALAAHVLREANSVMSAAQSAIGSLDQAVVRLGAARVLEIAIRSQIEGRLAADLPVYHLAGPDRRRHAVATSIAAEICARATNVALSRDVISAALLHDMGKDVINAVAEASNAELLYGAGLPVIEIEQELVEADHAEVGALVMSKWGLPETLVSAVRNHHDPSASPEAALVCLAEGMCVDLLPASESETDDDAGGYAEAADLLGLTEELAPLQERVGEALEAAGLTAD